jgi:hypothetical protein
MIRAQATARIARPVDRVYAFVALDFVQNYKRWSPEVVTLELLTPGPIRVGTRGHQVRVDYGHRTEAGFCVSALEDAKRIDFAGTSDPFLISYQMQALGGQTGLTFIFELSRLQLYMRPFERLIRTTVQREAERVVMNIKRLIEREISDPTA